LCRRLLEHRSVSPVVAIASASLLPLRDYAFRAKQPSNASRSISTKPCRNVLVRGDEARRGQEGLQSGLLAAPAEIDVLAAFHTGVHSAHRHDEYIDQSMASPASHPRIDESHKTSRQLFDPIVTRFPPPITGNDGTILNRQPAARSCATPDLLPIRSPDRSYIGDTQKRIVLKIYNTRKV
jgi:hypothetical protein